MYKIAVEKSVTSMPNESEINIFISENPEELEKLGANLERVHGSLSIDSETGDRRVLFFSNKLGFVDVYFRKCRGCGSLFPTIDRRQFYHTRNCQMLSYYDRLSKSGESRRCKNCGKSLKGKNKSAKTCSDACRMVIYRRSKEKKLF